VAGGGFGYYGDNGRAAQAGVAFPYGVSVDAIGNIFIAGKSSICAVEPTPVGVGADPRM
jgi:hypothetical protein